MSLSRFASWFLSLFGYDRPEQERKTAHVEEALDAAANAVVRQQRTMDVHDTLIADLKSPRETGIWPQDMIRGTYRVNRRQVRRGHS
jgi:hypothetical protein